MCIGFCLQGPHGPPAGSMDPQKLNDGQPLGVGWLVQRTHFWDPRLHTACWISENRNSVICIKPPSPPAVLCFSKTALLVVIVYYDIIWGMFWVSNRSEPFTHGFEPHLLNRMPSCNPMLFQPCVHLRHHHPHQCNVLLLI